MEAYSSKKLTDPRDRLSAISGLASLALGNKDISAQSYLAGLWKEDLVQGLLWYVVGPTIPYRFPTYIAQSWSWASVHGSIKYFHERYQFLFSSDIQINSASCSTSVYDPTGRVTSGSIPLTGQVVPVDLAVLPCPQPYRSEYSGRPGCASRIHRDQVVVVQAQLPIRNRMSAEKYYEVLCDERMTETVCNKHKFSQLCTQHYELLRSHWKLEK